MARPRINKTPEEMQAKADKYCIGPRPTICGLALALGFVERRSLYDGIERNDVFSPIIKKAMLIVESKYERDLRGKNAGGCIFALKNMKWQDKHEFEGNFTGEIVFKENR